MASLSMLGPFSIDTAFPAFAEMRGEFDVGAAEMQWVVSAYMLAFALMSPFHGPLSDAIGRKPVIVVGVGVYALASVGCALAGSLEVLLLFRVVQGLAAGGGVIVSRTVIRDVFEGPEAQRLMSITMMIFGIAPALAPIIGGGLIQLGPWHVIFWFLALLALVMSTSALVLLPETHPAERRTPLRPGALLHSLALPLKDAVFHRIAWSAALSFGGQFLYIGAAAIFVVDLLGKGETDFWMLFVPMIGGMVIGSFVSSRTAGRISSRVLITGALSVSLAGAVVNVALALGPLEAGLPWAVIGPAVIGLGSGAAYPVQQLALLDLHPTARGGAVSLFTFFSLGLNALLAALVTPLVTDSVLHLALTALVMVSAGLLLWLWHLRVSAPPVAPLTPDPVPEVGA
ncbi:multidrug effflux MFS transporter [Nocardioides alcanivorans]|uniref:multidrug effflux MFS transporter n=1 Tax=Nocardioides alcanivorans TaxID=2897352 RepID=UPI001F48FD3E|nr:multidrug effflux MFS transporter [Nocardioides alcanivorans]